MRLATVKLASAAATLIVGWVGVALPWTMQKHTRALSLANMLASGVMLGGGLIHLLPDAAEQLSEAWKGTEYPFANLLFVAGLLLPLVVESLLGTSHGDAAWVALSHHADAQPLWGAPASRNAALHQRGPADFVGGSDTAPSSSDNDELGGKPAGVIGRPRRREARLSSALLLLCALSFHSVLEGLAQGAASSVEDTAVLMGAILLHKGLAGFSLGCLLAESGLTRWSGLLLGLLFASATPLGTLLGMAVTYEEGGATSACAVAMAGGSFTFVALLEILPRELHSHSPDAAGSGPKMAMLVLGVGLMAVLGVWM